MASNASCIVKHEPKKKKETEKSRGKKEKAFGNVMQHKRCKKKSDKNNVAKLTMK